MVAYVEYLAKSAEQINSTQASSAETSALGSLGVSVGNQAASVSAALPTSSAESSRLGSISDPIGRKQFLLRPLQTDL